jgi:xanthine/CO dehydrogenase XdhC/CoxF family maturation factor
MTELDLILKAWRAGAPDAVLATVVHVKGSAYRSPGARMLILPDGKRIGSISGGCLEGEVCQKARWLTENGKPALRVYDSISDDDAVWEFGLGCNGVVQVLLERIDSPEVDESLHYIEASRSNRKPAVIATVISTSPESGLKVGGRLMLDDTHVSGSLARAKHQSALCEHARVALREGTNRTVELEGCQLFIEVIRPPLPLVIFGAGHDAIPLVSLAKSLGWFVTVADGRPAYAKQDRFALADRVLLTTADDPTGSIAIDYGTAVILMTHNYPQDRKLLERIVPLLPRYLGVLGPRARTLRLLEHLDPALDLFALHAPVGLDIGAETPESIAISIVAEILANLAGRTGEMLKLRRGPIHAREQTEAEETAMQREPRACAL